jgi:hypothetical protein
MGEKEIKIEDMVNRDYQYGFKTNLEPGMTIKGLSEETIRFISSHKKEPRIYVGISSKSVSSLAKNERAGMATCFV